MTKLGYKLYVKVDMIRVIYFCPSEGMYGDNIALMRIMPYLVEKGVIPFFVVSFEGPFVDYLKKINMIIMFVIIEYGICMI